MESKQSLISAIDFSCKKSKKSLVFSSYICVTTGVILLAGGIYVRFAYNDYYELIPSPLYFVTGCCITISTISFTTGYLVLYGTVKESENFIFWFQPVMFLINLMLFLQLPFAWVSAYQHSLGVQEDFERTIKFYGQDNYELLTTDWDKMQNEFSCCGVSNASDWLSLSTQDLKELPLSCCPISESSCNATQAYSAGCMVFLSWLRSYANVLLWISLTGFLAQIIATVKFFGAIQPAEEICRKKLENLQTSIDLNKQYQNEKHAIPNENATYEYVL